MERGGGEGFEEVYSSVCTCKISQKGYTFLNNVTSKLFLQNINMLDWQISNRSIENDLVRHVVFERP